MQSYFNNNPNYIYNPSFNNNPIAMKKSQFQF